MKKVTVFTTEDAEPPSFVTDTVDPTEDSEPPGSPAAVVAVKTVTPRISGKTGMIPRGAALRTPPGQLSLRLPGAGGIQVSQRSEEFRRRFFPEATAAEWNNWRWQLRHRLKSAAHLENILSLSEEERSALTRRGGALPVAITPYYASLLDPENPRHPLRRAVVPTCDEFLLSGSEACDPLHEDEDSPVPGLVHRYPDRVLFLVTGFCSTYCRYCTRSRMVGHHEHRFNPEQWEKAIAYIEATPSVRDVLLSGGDPLTLPDVKLEWLLWRLSRIPHVEFLRIGSKVPVVLPQRITPALVRRLRRYHPLWMSIHFTHAEEITPEVSQACARLADAGIPLGSQTVLLSGINDSVEAMRDLTHGLLRSRVKPYYLYQCDPIPGSSHFRTPVDKGLEIIRGLRGFTSGYAVPTYVIDAPGGGGKIPLIPDPVAGRDGGDVLLRNYAGGIYRYPDRPTVEPAAGPDYAI